MISRCLTAQTGKAVIKVGRGGCERFRTFLTGIMCLCIGWNPVFTMSARVVDEHICLCVRRVCTGWAGEGNTCIRIGVAVRRRRILWMMGRKVVMIGGLL